VTLKSLGLCRMTFTFVYDNALLLPLDCYPGPGLHAASGSSDTSWRI
jgi:hypothetical protein